MKISEKLLRKWRRDALVHAESWERNQTAINISIRTLLERQLRMTQDLLDQYLIKRERR